MDRNGLLWLFFHARMSMVASTRGTAGAAAGRQRNGTAGAAAARTGATAERLTRSSRCAAIIIQAHQLSVLLGIEEPSMVVLLDIDGLCAAALTNPRLPPSRTRRLLGRRSGARSQEA